MQIFRKDSDYRAFEKVIFEAAEKVPMRLLAYTIMPNHWHMVLWPWGDDELPEFMHWLSMTHAQRWHVHYDKVGTGHLYQGRFKSFVIQSDESLLRVCGYVERNPLRAGLVKRAEDWPWSSLWKREFGVESMGSLLSEWPVKRPGDWLSWMNQAENEAELERLRQSVNRGRPFGEESWVVRTAETLGLPSTLRRRGRPTSKSS